MITHRTYTFDKIGSGYVMKITEKFSEVKIQEAMSRAQAMKEVDELMERIQRDLDRTCDNKVFRLDVTWGWEAES